MRFNFIFNFSFLNANFRTKCIRISNAVRVSDRWDPIIYDLFDRFKAKQKYKKSNVRFQMMICRFEQLFHHCYLIVDLVNDFR